MLRDHALRLYHTLRLYSDLPHMYLLLQFRELRKEFYGGPLAAGGPQRRRRVPAVEVRVRPHSTRRPDDGRQGRPRHAGRSGHAQRPGQQGADLRADGRQGREHPAVRRFRRRKSGTREGVPRRGRRSRGGQACRRHGRRTGRDHGHQDRDRARQGLPLCSPLRRSLRLRAFGGRARRRRLISAAVCRRRVRRRHTPRSAERDRRWAPLAQGSSWRQRTAGGSRKSRSVR